MPASKKIHCWRHNPTLLDVTPCSGVALPRYPYSLLAGSQAFRKTRLQNPAPSDVGRIEFEHWATYARRNLKKADGFQVGSGNARVQRTLSLSPNSVAEETNAIFRFLRDMGF